MSARVVAAVMLLVGAGGAASVPFVLDGPLLSVDFALPAMASGAHDGHGADEAPVHASHARSGKAPAGHAGPAGHSHSTSTSSSGGEPTEVHSGHHGEAQAAEASAPGHGDHAAHLGDQPGMQRPQFPPAEGRIPASMSGLTRISSLFIESDSAFESGEVAIPGAGTLGDPYVLRGLAVDGDLFIADTDACFVVAENYVAGQLTLNWNGQCVWVHHNFVRDLRVNENVMRKGYATGGLIEQNKFGLLGQLRHFDGEFRGNEVGPFDGASLYDPVKETVLYPFLYDTRVANIDGFNQGLIHHNTFLGTVDLDFHGHHHGTGFFAPHSHYHGSSEARQKSDLHDHADRWTSVAFTDNTVVDPKGYGLRYEDQAHSGDDRSATSEDMEVLEEPHVHHTDILLARNTVRGGQLWVDVFNADDPNHPKRNAGTLTIADNSIELNQRADEGHSDVCGIFLFGEDYDPWSAIHVQFAKEVRASITGNRMTYVPLKAAPSPQQTVLNTVGQALHECALWPDDRTVTAIRLEDLRDADVLVQGNTATGFAVGVGATFLDEDTDWQVVGNDFGKARAIWYDDSVDQPPRTT